MKFGHGLYGLIGHHGSIKGIPPRILFEGYVIVNLVFHLCLVMIKDESKLTFHSHRTYHNQDNLLLVLEEFRLQLIHFLLT